MSQAAAPGPVGRRLGHYQILGVLGAGGMGEVYLAEDTRLGRRVALKLLPKETAADPDRIERFEREARAIAALSHPNIVTLHSIEEAEGQRFLSLEYVEGQTLGQLVPETGLPVDRFLKLAIPLTDALAAAHQRGILHRDLKPDNVMVTPEGRLKVLDFGLAKLRQAEPEPAGDAADRRTASVTQDGRILGTVAYMSPEQAQGLPIDHRSDIFSLGILLYELVTGARPFQGATNLSILSSILKDEPQPITDRNGAIPRPLARMIQRALAKRPEDRYQSATDLRKDLEDLKRDLDTGELLSTVSASRPSLPALRLGRRAWLTPALALLAVLLLLAAVFLRVKPRASAGSVVGARPALAVFYFENITGDPALEWLRTGLTDMLVTDLSQAPNLRVLSTGRLYQLLEELGAREAPTTSLEMVQQVARRAEVGLALVGSFVKSGERLRIQARLQDAASGEVLASERVEGDGEESLFALVDELTRRIQRSIEDQTAVTARGMDRELGEVTTRSVEAYRYYVEGLQRHERMEEQEALPLLEKAVAIDPDFAMALAKLSVVHGNLGDNERAEEYARRAFLHVDRLTPAERHYIEGRYYSLDPARVEDAIQAYGKAVDLFPDHSSARNNLAALLMATGRRTEAIGHLEELRRRGMTFPGTWGSLAELLAGEGEPERALAVVREFVGKHPDSAAGYANLARVFGMLGRYDEALAAFRRAHDLEPANLEYEGGSWFIHALREEWDAAERSARRLLEAPTPGLRWQGGAGLMLVALYRGDVAGAEAVLARALDGFRGQPQLLAQTYVVRSTLRNAIGDAEAALADARAALALEPEEPGLRAFALSRVALSLTRLDRVPEAEKAQAEAEAAVARLPDPVREPWLSLAHGELALARGDASAALPALEQANRQLQGSSAKLDDRTPEIWYRLGEARLATGDRDGARQAFGRLAEAGFERLAGPIAYVRSLEQLARLEQQAGNRERARALYERYLAYWKGGTIDPERVARAERTVAGLTATASR